MALGWKGKILASTRSMGWVGKKFESMPLEYVLIQCIYKYFYMLILGCCLQSSYEISYNCWLRFLFPNFWNVQLKMWNMYNNNLWTHYLLDYKYFPQLFQQFGCVSIKDIGTWNWKWQDMMNVFFLCENGGQIWWEFFSHSKWKCW
jgi:hypothetical protein